MSTPNKFVCGLERESQRNTIHDDVLEIVDCLYPMLENDEQRRCWEQCKFNLNNIFSL